MTLTISNFHCSKTQSLPRIGKGAGEGRKRPYTAFDRCHLVTEIKLISGRFIPWLMGKALTET